MYIYLKTVEMQSLIFYIWRMKAKWYLSTLIVVLALFGVNQHQTSLPNQEIVLQFADLEVTSHEAQITIVNVKERLQSLGADNIQVRKGTEGKLKITYYSDSDVASIKKVLSKTNSGDLGFPDLHLDEESNDFPSNDNSNSYDLEVYEIQNDSDADWDLEGITVVELKSENHRIFNPNVYAAVQCTDARGRIVKVAFKIHTHIATAIDTTSGKIPEVRAGPFSLGAA